MAWHLFLMAGLYILAGINHFIMPKLYGHIMPKDFPMKREMVWLSGIAEILLGVGLFFDETRKWAIFGIILMLAIFFIVHFDMIKNSHKFKIPKWILYTRIPLQFFLIYWAYSYL